MDSVVSCLNHPRRVLCFHNMVVLLPVGFRLHLFDSWRTYTKTTRQCKVSFNCNYCVGCPYQGQCRPKIDGWNATFITSKNASNRAKSQRYMQSEEFSNYAKLRNGVETVPANIRKNYRLDKLPRGKQRAKFFFGSKIAALNFRKLFGFRKGLVNYAQNPIFG